MNNSKRDRIFTHISELNINGKKYCLNHVKDYNVHYPCEDFTFKLIVWTSTHVYTKGVTELNNNIQALYKEYNVKRNGQLVPIEYRIFDKSRYQLSLQLKRIVKNEFNNKVYKTSNENKVLSIPLNDISYLIVFTLERKKNRFILKIISAYEQTDENKIKAIQEDIKKQNNTVIDILKSLKNKKAMT